MFIFQRIALGLVFVLSFSGAARSFQQAETGDQTVVRISVDLVQVDAVVTNSKDEPVTDLTADDFIILQDGKPQEITNFSFIRTEDPDKPAAPADKRAAAKRRDRTEPLPPAMPLRREKHRRTIAILVDDLGLSAEYAMRTRQWVRNWLESQMQPNDLVAVMRTGAGVGALHQFTNDRRLLTAAADLITYNAASRVVSVGGGDPVAKSGEIRRDAYGMSLPMVDEERDLVYTKFSLKSIQYTAEGMKDLPGRKSIIVITEKLQLQFHACAGEDQGRTAAMRGPLRGLIDTANRYGVVIHTVDPRGVVNTQNTCELLSSQDGMVTLAKQTGGIFMAGHNDIDRALKAVSEDGNGYYLIGYQPDSKTVSEMKKGKAKLHKIEVRVKRRGLTVRSRSEFMSSPDNALPTDLIARQIEVAKAYYSPFKTEDLRVRLTGLFSQTKDGQSVINTLMHFDANQLVFTEEPDGWRKATIEVTAGLYGADGEEIDFADKTWNLTATGKSYEFMQKNGIAFLMNVPVKKPGAYQMRLVLRDTATARLGSATQVIEVPDLRQGRLALSGILLAADASKSAAAVDRAEGVIEEEDSNKTAAVRIFESGETIAWAYQILNARAGKDRKPQLMAQVRLFHEGREVYEGKATAMESGEQGDSKRMIASDQMHLKQLPPGYYVLQIAVMDMLAKEEHRMAVQAIDFDARRPNGK